MEAQEKTSRITEALRSPAYADTDPARRRMALTMLLMDELDRKGQNASAADTTALRLDTDIADYYGRQVTLPEVELAVRWGLRGEYGDFTGINPDRLFRFVRSYIESGERMEAMRQRRAPQRQQEKVDAPALNWTALHDRTLELWQEYREGGCLGFTQRYPSSQIWPVWSITRHVAADCWAWLKVQGLVEVDDELARQEADALRRASAVTAREANAVEAPERAARSLAGAMLLEAWFTAAARSGYDVAENIRQSSEATPPQERRFCA